MTLTTNPLIRLNGNTQTKSKPHTLLINGKIAAPILTNVSIGMPYRFE